MNKGGAKAIRRIRKEREAVKSKILSLYSDLIEVEVQIAVEKMKG